MSRYLEKGSTEKNEKNTCWF